MKKINLIIFLALLFTILFLIIGFIIGKIYYLNYYNLHPLVTGIREINKINDANFTCGCFSTKDRTITFNFDENKIYEAYFWNG